MSPEEARKVLRDELDWPEWMVDLGIQANFCCEYCGKNLLSDVDTYADWQKDHIVPNGGDSKENLAISCKTCNFIKKNTDPRDYSSSHDRSSLIEAAKGIVEKRRKKKQNNLNRTCQAVDALINNKSK